LAPSVRSADAFDKTQIGSPDQSRSHKRYPTGEFGVLAATSVAGLHHHAQSR